MCGRHALMNLAEVFSDRFQLEALGAYEPSYNIAPGQNIAVVLTEKPHKVGLRHDRFLRRGRLLWWDV